MLSKVEKAGFRLVGTSELGANPRDTADYPEGVWALPPTLKGEPADRARYEANGEADNFILKFVKVDEAQASAGRRGGYCTMPPTT